MADFTRHSEQPERNQTRRGRTYPKSSGYYASGRVLTPITLLLDHRPYERMPSDLLPDS